MEVEEQEITIGEHAKRRGRPRKYKPREPVEDEEDTLPPSGDSSNSISWKKYWQSFYNDPEDEKDAQRHKDFHKVKNSSSGSLNPLLFKVGGVTALTAFMLYLQSKNNGEAVISSGENTVPQTSLTEAVREATNAVTQPVETVKEQITEKVAQVAQVVSVDSVEKAPDTPKPNSTIWGKKPEKKYNKW